MNTAKNFLALILLILGFVACNDDDPVVILPDPDPRPPESLNARGIVRETGRLAHPNEEDQFQVEFEGEGGSNVWEQYRIALAHNERGFGGAGRFEVTAGTFSLTDADGEEFISGTYRGTGTTDENGLKRIEESWTVTNIGTSQVAILGNILKADLQQLQNGSYSLLITGQGQLPPPAATR